MSLSWFPTRDHFGQLVAADGTMLAQVTRDEAIRRGAILEPRPLPIVVDTTSEHDHRWGNLGVSRLAGNLRWECLEDGCRVISLPLDADDMRETLEEIDRERYFTEDEARAYLELDSGHAPCCYWGTRPEFFTPAILELAWIYGETNGEGLSIDLLDSCASTIVNDSDGATADTFREHARAQFREDHREELARPAWIVGYNMPGYMPEMEPYACEDFDSAKRALVDEIKRAEDSCAQVDDETGAEDLCAIAEDVNLWSGEDSVIWEGSDSCPSGLAYWINYVADHDWSEEEGY